MRQEIEQNCTEERYILAQIAYEMRDTWHFRQFNELNDSM